MDLPSDDRFGEGAVGTPSSRRALRRSRAARPLHVCPDCASQLVYPVSWADADQDRWELELRCPNCEWRERALHDHGAVVALDEELERATDALVCDLRKLTEASMLEAAARLRHALDADLLLPEDF